MKSIKYLLLGLIILSPVFSFSNTLKVPTQFPTIQEAIDNATNGDTILVADGIYEGEINFNGLVADSVIIKSESGPNNCIIDCQNQSYSSGFIFNSKDCKSTVKGFTIKNAWRGIYAYANSTPVLINNIIENCESGIYCGSASKPVVKSNIIRNCTGRGMDISWSEAIVINNLIINNSGFKFGGIYCYHSSPSIINNTILNNASIDKNDFGGEIYLDNSSPDIINNIIAFSDGIGIAVFGSSSLPNISYNVFYDNGGGNYFVGETSETASFVDLTGVDGNIAGAPMFYLDNYSLTPGSPCVDAGTPDTTGLGIGDTDFLGLPRIFDGDNNGVAVIDMGAVELQISSGDNIENVSICQGEEYEGHTESGVFQRTLTSATGTDSIVATYLTVNPTYNLHENVTICEGEDYFGLTVAGEYMREFKTVNNCDSTIATNLSVRPIDDCYLTLRVPSGYPTIQSAMDAANPGDTVLVADGTHTGEGNLDLKFNKKAIVVKSENGPENCIIDCQNQSASMGFIFNRQDDKGTVEGFTIKNATIGIWAYANSSPTIKNNIIENCSLGMECSSEAKPIISANIIRNCGGLGSGGGISIVSSDALVTNNLIIRNHSAKGGGIFCKNSSPSIINNTIVGNSGIGVSGQVSDDPILRCEYDNYNRIYECYVPLDENGLGGGIYLEDASPDIINNIVAFSKESQEPTEPSSGLSRWFYSDLFMRYNYEGGKLFSITYYYGFKNNGETGNLHLYNNQKHGSAPSIDTTFTIQSGERYWIETTSWVSPTGDYGGLNLVAHIYDDSIGVNVTIDNPLFSGCYYLLDTKIQSQGIVEGETGGAEIIAIGNSSFPNIVYNNIYGNGGGNYLSGETEEAASIFDLTGSDGNISSDPLINEETYELLEGSPCIDAGKPDLTGLDIGSADYFGNPRILNGTIDIGAVEYQSITVETEEYVSICQGEEYEGHTESAAFQRTLISSIGTDSIVTTHLTVNPTYKSEEYVSICEGGNYLSLTEEGSHAREFETIHSCDSTVITHLTVNPVFDLVENVSICEGDSYHEWTAEGRYPVTYTTAFGCDSTVTTNLSFHPSFKPAFTADADTLISNEIYSAYQWYDTGGAIAGATGQKLVIGNSGEYYLEGTNEHGCTYASDVQYVIKTYTAVYSSGEFEFSVMPNPNRGVFLFRIDANPPENLSVKLVNGLGQVIETRIIPNPAVNQTEPFHVSHLSAGVYHFVVISDKLRDTRKIVIQ